MRLILSSAALPDDPLETLRRGARKRDLEGLEWVTSPSEGPPVPSAEQSLTDGTPPVRWVLLDQAPAVTDVLYWSRQAHLLGAGLLLRSTVGESPLSVPLATLHGTDPEAAQRAAAWARMHDAQTCWELQVGAPEEATMDQVLSITAPTLGHVRLVGAGPEAESARGTSSVTSTFFKELALRGYDGTVALAPSGREQEAEWRRWLFDERGWGCNTAAKKREAAR